MRLRLVGRESVDFVRTQGVEIRLEHIDHALRHLEKYLGQSLLVVVREHMEDDKIQAELSITVTKKDGIDLPFAYLNDLVREAIMELALSPQTRLRDAIARGTFTEPLVVIEPARSGKEKSRSIRFIEN